MSHNDDTQPQPEPQPASSWLTRMLHGVTVAACAEQGILPPAEAQEALDPQERPAPSQGKGSIKGR